MVLFFLCYIALATPDEIILKNNDGTQKEVFNVNKSADTLTISFNGKRYQYKNIIGIEGQIYKDFLIFNNQPALWYSNTASKNTYDIYYTLLLKANGIVIDCAYANISYSDYNITLNRAICGLNKKLNSDYIDLIYPFSDKWQENISHQIKKLNTKKSNLFLGKIGDISILVNYNTNKELNPDLSETIFKFRKKEYEPFPQKLYLISLAKNPNKLIRIDQPIDKEDKKTFKKLNKENLKSFIITNSISNMKN